VLTVASADEADEARRIVMLAAELRAPGARWSSVAVLGRTHEILRQIGEAFTKAGIPTRTVTRRGTAGRAADDLLRQARSAGDGSELHAWAIDLAWPNVDARSGDAPPADEADNDWVDDGGQEHADPLEPVRRAIETVKAFEDAGGGNGRAFAAWMELNNIESAPEGDAVELVTMHAAKGREWPVVIVAGVDSVGFPAPSARASARAEEARLLYVALTRAVDRLAVSWATRRNGKNAVRSPLLPDLEAEAAPDIEVVLPSTTRSTPPPTGTDPVGDAVRRLTTWRTGAARAAGIPANFLLDDATLRRIAETAPTSETELAAIEGVGPLLAKRFAPRILPLLSAPGDSDRVAQ
jgi:DNA helicase-2/ATP-dependent DNA helicase PcrA